MMASIAMAWNLLIHFAAVFILVAGFFWFREPPAALSVMTSERFSTIKTSVKGCKGKAPQGSKK